MSAKKANIRLEGAVLCDEIRKEINNKLILIGVYPNDIIVAEFPTEVRLSIYAVARASQALEASLVIKWALDGVDMGGLRANLAITNPDEKVIITTPSLPVFLEKGGELTFDLVIQDQEPLRLVSKRVISGVVPS